MPEPTVPNWIAKALILTPSYTGTPTVAPITGWRATRTQVVVTSLARGERRFYLKDLTEVGDRSYGSGKTRLVAPDDERAIAARRAMAVRQATGSVLVEVDRQRLQDSTTTAEDAVRKLTAVQDAVNKALASLAEVL